jgi:hypothetical protein
LILEAWGADNGGWRRLGGSLGCVLERQGGREWWLIVSSSHWEGQRCIVEASTSIDATVLAEWSDNDANIGDKQVHNAQEEKNLTVKYRFGRENDVPLRQVRHR